jgi:hypothetical protein
MNLEALEPLIEAIVAIERKVDAITITAIAEELKKDEALIALLKGDRGDPGVPVQPVQGYNLEQVEQVVSETIDKIMIPVFEGLQEKLVEILKSDEDFIDSITADPLPAEVPDLKELADIVVCVPEFIRKTKALDPLPPNAQLVADILKADADFIKLATVPPLVIDNDTVLKRIDELMNERINNEISEINAIFAEAN